MHGTSKLYNLSRRMKREPTPTERAFRDRLKAEGILFYTQKVIGFYIADFIIPDRMLVIELDGEVHLSQHARDARRDAFIARYGFTVLRIPNGMSSAWSLRQILSFPIRPRSTYTRAIRRAGAVRGQAQRRINSRRRHRRS